MNNIKNVAGILKTITLDKFIDLLSVMPTDESVFVPYNARINSCSGVSFEGDEDVATYQRRISPLVESKQELINTLISNIGLGHMFYSDVRTISEDLVIRNLEGYGSPEYFVKISDRVWMVANIEDFRIWEHKTTGLKSLGVLAPSLSVAWKISKITVKEADEIAKQYMEKKDEI